MEVKANVQRRRQSRLRELQSRSQEQPRLAPAPVPGQAGSPAVRWAGPLPMPGQWPELPDSRNGDLRGSKEPHSGLPLYMRGQPDLDHGGDPELAWKERQKQLLAWYAQEERYGSGEGFPSEKGNREKGHYPGRGPFFQLFRAKLVLAGVLFAAVWGIFQWDAGWTHRAQAVVTEALTHEMDFSQAAAWYQNTFSGAPSFLPAFGERQNAVKVQANRPASLWVQPVRGTVTKPFSNKGEGIWLAVKPDAQVAALDQGRVESAGLKEGFGYLVTIRHTDGIRASYGGLRSASWQAGDWVKAGEVIGHAQAEEGAAAANVYLAVMKDERFINPLEVVTFD